MKLSNDEINKIVADIFAIDSPKDIGVIISLLSANYLDKIDITEKQFFNSLKKSIRLILKENEREDSNDRTSVIK